MAGIVIFFTNPGAYTFTAGAVSTQVDIVGAGGGGGAGAVLTSGGDGGRGGYRSQVQVTTIGQTYAVSVAPPSAVATNGQSTTFAALTATGGDRGADATALGNGSDGANGTPDATNPYNAGTPGVGGGLLNIGQTGGGQGIAVISYNTGTGQITHTASMDRSLILARLFTAAIVHTANFSRLVTVRRLFSASITHTPEETHRVRLPRLASIIHQANKTDKAVRLTRTDSITHTSDASKKITPAPKNDTIQHNANFARQVTIRRTFNAAISHIAKCYLYLEARLLPSGSGTTIIKKFFNILFDD